MSGTVWVRTFSMLYTAFGETVIKVKIIEWAPNVMQINRLPSGDGLEKQLSVVLPLACIF